MIITRAKLHRAIWETPACHLSKMYGISDVALGKICRRHVIPKPWKDYWTEVAHGKKPNRLPLPPWSGADTIQIKAVMKPLVRTGAGRSGQPARTGGKDFELLAIKKQENTHPQTKRLRLAIQSLKEDQTGRLGDQRKGVIRGVLVSRPQLTRALALLDALFRLVEEAGCAVVVAPQNERSGGLVFRYKEAIIDAQLIEEVRRRGRGASVNEWTYELTG